MSPVVDVSHLVKRYKKSPQNSVDNITFQVAKGEFFSLLGPNGAGKTTTISILTTTLSKTSGRALVAGFNIDTQAHDVRQHIGIIFQNPSLDQNLTSEENLRFHAALYHLYPYRPFFALMPDSYKRRVKELTDVLRLTSADLAKPVKTLSGGMKRKFEIVRSLLHRPEILFLDEPTAGLDPQARQNLWDYLNSIRRLNGTTIFLTTHYLEEAEDSDTVCILKNGKIVAQGSPAAIKKVFAGRHTTLEQAYLKIIQDE